MQKHKDDYPALTSFRGIGALLVLQYHAWLFVDPAWPQSWAYHRIQLWPDYFFMLSGFIMVHVYGPILRNAGRREIYNYFVARIGRIYPLHVFVLLALVGFEAARWAIGRSAGIAFDPAPFTGAYQLKYLATNLPLIQSWGIQHVNAWNAPAWSISSELFCYFLFPVVVMTGLMTRKWGNALILAYAVAALVALQATQGTLHVIFGLSLLRASAEFLIGCWIRQNLDLIRAGFQALPRSLLQVMALLLIPAAYYYEMMDLFFVLLWALLLVLFTFDDTKVAQAVGSGPLYRLGEISYSIYLTHWFFLLLLHAAIQAWPPLLSVIAGYPVLSLLTLFMIVIGASFVTYHWVEMPARRWVRIHCMSSAQPGKPVLATVPLWTRLSQRWLPRKMV